MASRRDPALEARYRSSMPPLTQQLEEALVRRLRGEYSTQSWRHFDSKLILPAIRLSDSTRVLAAWDGQARTLEVSRRLLLEVPWGAVVEVLKHEMAHQYVYEVLRVHHETAHGETFQRVCMLRGIDGAAHGVPTAESTEASAAVDRMREKVRRLLALAGSSNPHEAELAMLRAREILLRHNLDAAPRTDGYVVRWVGTPKKRISRAEYTLGGILATHFHVEVMWVRAYQPLEGHDATVLELCGTPGNVEMAEYVYTFLMGAAQRAYEARREEIGGRARQAFLTGVMRGFHDKLDQQGRKLTGAGLVWVGDAQLEDWNRRRYPRRRSVGGGRTTQWDAHQQGRRDGAEIVLSRPISSGGSGKTRLLPPGSR